jgi:RNA polymerase sigma-70 factor (ECF subfamily)
MGNQLSTIVEPAEMGWIVERANLRDDELAPWCRQVERELYELADRHMAAFAQHDGAKSQLATAGLASRLWHCIVYHWQSTPGCPKQFGNIVKHLEKSAESVAGEDFSLLHEVSLAAALERMQPEAATMFEQRYMPKVRSFARQVAGVRGQELVDDFAATLVMPRDSAPPRIRQYQGKTSLAKWLRVVVTNYCLSQLRRKQPVALEAAPEVQSMSEPAPLVDNRRCLELLTPVIAAAVKKLDAADRLLIKLLLLDEVPQQQVAKSLGIHSGNVTRRKQKIMDTIWSGIRSPRPEGEGHAEFRDCMESVVAGDDFALTSELAGLVGAAFGEAGNSAPKGRLP